MRSVGLPELMVALGGIVAIGFYGVMFFVLWKFYQVLSNINQNIAGIKRAIEQNNQRQ
ncbi:MAG TPA: hypothetical protein VGF49_04450 [Candidatus Solibacter sp.]|jgi:hypothetical protein